MTEVQKALRDRIDQVAKLVREYEGCEELDCEDMIYDTLVAIGAAVSDDDVARSVARRLVQQ